MLSHTARCLLILAILLAPARSQPSPHRIYVCGIESKGYVVGAKLPPSGLFLYQPPAWRQLGFNHPTINSVTYNPRDPKTLYIAAGNGCIRSADSGKSWRILTSWQMTEIQDVALDSLNPTHILIALPDGIGYSGDDGRSWSHRDSGLPRKFVQSINADRTRGHRFLAGTETGLYVSEDSGLHWRLAGAKDSMITAVEQSPAQTSLWMATTQQGGLFLSTDNAHTFSKVHNIPAEHALYNVSLHPYDPNLAAVCGWHLGIRVSQDGGKTWLDRTQGLPSNHLWRVAFDPSHKQRLWASVHEEAVFFSDDLGLTWTRAGLEGSIVRDFVFIPEVRQ